MTVRVGINGFGRIGRQSLKAIIERAPDVEVVAVNDLVDAEMNALLFKHDSTYGAYPGTVEHTDDALIIDGREIKVLAGEGSRQRCRGATSASTSSSSRPASSPTPRRPSAHLDAGAKKVIISAPAKGEDITIVLGVNEDTYDPAATTSSATPAARRTAWPRRPRSSTTSLGIERGLMNTIHSYTNDQRILDVAHKDPRRARARRPEHHPDDDRRREGAGPRHPGAQGQVRRLQPARPDADRQRRRLHGRRPPRRPRVEELNAAFRAAAAGPDEGHPRRVSDEPLVSIGLPGRLALVDHRRAIDDGPRRDDGQGHRLVRQRVGLQLPRRRPGRVRRRPAARRR